MKIVNFGLAGVLGGLGVIVSTLAAQAVNFNFSYTAGSVTTSGIFTTESTNNQGEYLITGITGTRNGTEIALLPEGIFNNNDNLIYPNASDPNKLTFYGFSFVSGGNNYNFFANNKDEFLSFEDLDSGYYEYTQGTFQQSYVRADAFNVSPVATAVPFDFNSAEGAALGVPLFIGLGILRKKIARKSTASKGVVAVR